MTYTPTTWVDGTTPVNAANLNKIEAGVLAAIPRDDATATGTRIFANKLLAADAQPAFRIMGDGSMYWGPGGSSAPDADLVRMSAATLKTNGHFVTNGNHTVGYAGDSFKLLFGSAGDVNLYRAAAKTLKTDGTIVSAATGGFVSAFVADNLSNPGYALIAKIAGDAQYRFTLGGDGAMNWGPGPTGTDTNLYRASAGVLKTDGIFNAVGGLQVNGVPVGGSVGIGTSLPGSPTDGQEYILVDSLTAPTYAWRFRYTASISDSYKWVFIGGAPVTSAINTEAASSQTTLADLASTVGPDITCPRAGHYFLQWGFVARNGNTYMSYAEPCNGAGNTNITVGSLIAGMNVTGGGTGNNAGATMSGVTQGRAAGDIIRIKYRVDGNTSNFKYRWLTVVPIRVA